MNLIEEYTKRYNRQHLTKRSLTKLIVKLNRIADDFEGQTRSLFIEQMMNKRIIDLLKETGWKDEVTITMSHKAHIGEYYPVVSLFSGEDIHWEEE